MNIFRSEFVLGGQKSGKSRRAEQVAAQWLKASPDHRAVLIATTLPWDEEMRERIARHQLDRAQRVAGLTTVEEPLALGAALRQHSAPHTLVVVDCLTLWLTNLLMPADAGEAIDADGLHNACHSLCGALQALPGPVVLVGNEIGLGVVPLGREVRAFVDALGLLNQAVAAECERVTLMVAGLPLVVKGPA
jgi:adenosylcobinamide kinase/adenosylcobinamide-phosphate guanylyltransferase